jgi:non-ribosomal peptide synthetase-like protein
MHRGRVTLEKARLDNDTFLGNHVLIPGGQSLPPGILIGVSTIADDQKIKSNESWFGIPPFLLPKREVVEMSRALTHSPGLYRWLRRAFWEQLRFLLPLLIAALAYGFFEVVSQLQGHNSSLFFAVLLPACFLLMLLLSCLITILTKWLLLGRVKPGSHGLWSSWCARWDFLFLVWAALAKDVFIWLEGSTLLNLFLRLFGMKIGKRVLLGPEFAHVVDPDMLTIEDDAMVSCFLQVHTFEDRVLKIDRMRIRRRGTISRGTVILYGADIGESSHVRHNSVILKNEVLSPSTIYQGCPAARLGTEKTKAITTD